MLYTRFGLEFPAESAEDTLRRLPNVRHDALVIYNSKDAAWIEGTLSAELEQCPPYYSIVLPQRTRLRGDGSGELEEDSPGFNLTFFVFLSLFFVVFEIRFLFGLQF